MNESAANQDVSSDAIVPTSLHEVLSRDNLKVADASFAGGLSADEALEAFARLYDPKLFETKPVVYAVEIVASDETRLKPSTLVRMIHVPGVLQNVEDPAPEPGTEPTPTEIETDMFAFFDAGTGAHLATVYIGPPNAT